MHHQIGVARHHPILCCGWRLDQHLIAFGVEELPESLGCVSESSNNQHRSLTASMNTICCPHSPPYFLSPAPCASARVLLVVGSRNERELTAKARLWATTAICRSQ